jgi:uncharacterized phage protein (TIGR01671 family)
MREIKFRALQKISKNINLKPKMVYGTGIFKDPINTWLYSHDETNPMAAHMEYHIIDPLTIGQYTGLKDKNGVEIYEGDIMCYTKAGGHNSIGIVKYVNEFARWEYWHTTLKQGFPILSDCANMEVIGNIFEHPHLLEG